MGLEMNRIPAKSKKNVFYLFEERSRSVARKAVATTASEIFKV